MKKNYSPRLVSIRDKYGDDLTPPRLVRELLDADDYRLRPAPTVREDLQAVRRRPLDAPMATRIPPLNDSGKFIEIGIILCGLGLGFIAGLIVGSL